MIGLLLALAGAGLLSVGMRGAATAHKNAAEAEAAKRAASAASRASARASRAQQAAAIASDEVIASMVTALQDGRSAMLTLARSLDARGYAAQARDLRDAAQASVSGDEVAAIGDWLEGTDLVDSDDLDTATGAVDTAIDAGETGLEVVAAVSELVPPPGGVNVPQAWKEIPIGETFEAQHDERREILAHLKAVAQSEENLKRSLQHYAAKPRLRGWLVLPDKRVVVGEWIK